MIPRQWAASDKQENQCGARVTSVPPITYDRHQNCLSKANQNAYVLHVLFGTVNLDMPDDGAGLSPI